MKKILLGIGVLVFSINSYSNTTIVSGSGAASCPSGYLMTSLIIVPPSKYYLGVGSRNWAVSVGGTNAGWCKTIKKTGVSGCTRANGYGGKSGRYTEGNANVKIICAKSCGN